MSVSHVDWDKIPEQELLDAGNHLTTVRNATGEVVFEGLLAGWQETASGGLSLRRRVDLDASHPAAFDMMLIAAGEWATVTVHGYGLDFDMILAQEAAQREEEAEAERLSTLSIPNGTAPNRAARRGAGR